MIAESGDYRIPKIKDVEQIHNKWGQLSKYELEFSEFGVYPKIKQDWEVYNNNGDGACALLLSKDRKRVIITRQFRLPAYLHKDEQGLSLEFCAGKIDNDSPEVAIRREILEETGYKVEQLEYLFMAYCSPGSVMERVFFYFAYYDESMKISSGGGLEVENERLEVIEMSYQELFERLQNGEIFDMKTILLIQHLQLRLAPRS